MTIKGLSIGKFFKKIIERISKLDLLTQSAALSFYCALSLAPMMVLLLSSLSFLGENSKLQFLSQVRFILGAQASEAIKLIIEGSKEDANLRSVSGLISFVTLLVSASSVFSQLKSTISLIFSVKESTEELTAWQEVMQWTRERVFSIGILISFIFVSLVSMLFSVVVSLILPTGQGWLWQTLNQLLSVGIYAFVFFLVFYFIPHQKISKKNALTGGVICALLFILGKGLLSSYLSGTAVSSAYGASGSLIAFLIWVYYSSFIVFASGVVTSILAKDKK